MSIEQARNSLGQSIQELNAAIDVNEDIGRLQELSLAHSEVATVRLKDVEDNLPAYIYHASEVHKREHAGPSLTLAIGLGKQVVTSLDKAMGHLVPALDNKEAISKVGAPDDLQSLRGRINVADIRYIAAMHEYRYAKRVRRNFLEAHELAIALSEKVALPIGLKMNDADQFEFAGIRKSVDLLQQSAYCPAEQFSVILEAALRSITQQDLEFVQELHKAIGKCSDTTRSSLETKDDLMEVLGELLKGVGSIKKRL